MTQDGWLSAELEAALLRELKRCYEWENSYRFGERLRPAVIRLSPVASRFGAWIRSTRTIELSHSLVMNRPWPDIISVLEHEMAHQFVDEALATHDETSHGETFQRVCAQLGIDGRASGNPLGAETPLEADRVLDRIRKLLALAGSANQHEAEVAMRRAHELMLRHNIEAAQARITTPFVIGHLGDPTKRGNRVESAVIGLLTEFFFVEVIRIPVYLPLVGKSGQIYEITGTRTNVDMAFHVYAFLLATATRLWHANRLDTRVRSGRSRLSYQLGVIHGFRDKLLSERKELSGTGLVWRGDARLAEFYRRRHPRIHRRQERVRVDGAHQAGREAGRSIVLHRPIEHGESGGSPKLLRE
jgi:hypothetical protein